jgi:hypothetical protein
MKTAEIVPFPVAQHGTADGFARTAGIRCTLECDPTIFPLLRMAEAVSGFDDAKFEQAVSNEPDFAKSLLEPWQATVEDLLSNIAMLIGAHDRVAKALERAGAPKGAF